MVTQKSREERVPKKEKGIDVWNVMERSRKRRTKKK